ncbi:hypothetical protein DVH05_004907 [Phytophthora capsici]|nr:hypothetical protein DVH05_004907 [Phytophthora capsici]
MYSIFGRIVETDNCFGEDFDRDMTVRQLFEKMIVNKKWDCSVDELNLYFARKNGRRLDEYEPEGLDLCQGKLSDRLRKIMSDENKIDPDTKIQTFYNTCDTYLLLEAPPRIRRKYRDRVAETRRQFIKLGLITAEDADLEFLEELPSGWWETLRSYILPPKVATEKKKL